MAQSHWRTVTLAALIVGIILAVTHRAPHSAPRGKTPAAGVVTTSTDRPSEEPVTNYRSTATGAEPQYLRLTGIKAEGFIQKVGVDQHHQVAVPTNIHLAGWFASSVIPGEPGLSIIDGHLDGSRQPGIFADLAKLKPADTFTIDFANGTSRRFVVMTTQSLPVAESAAVLFSQDPSTTRQLNLITCAGAFKTSSGYDRRVVVTSRPAN